MNATKANLINSISLMIIGLWGYFDVLSPTALIPVLIGVFLILLIIGSIPLIIFGYVLHSTELINLLRNIKVIAWTTLFFGIILYFADQKKTDQNISSNLNIKSIIFIGLFQILALIPGVSRAGITMTAARFLNFNRVDSGKISFLLSIPALAGASFLGLKDLQNETLEINLLVIIAIVLSFLFSYITVKFFLNYLHFQLCLSNVLLLQF